MLEQEESESQRNRDGSSATSLKLIIFFQEGEYSFQNYPKCIIISCNSATKGFSQKNPKYLDPSYKMDLDHWDCFEGKAYNQINRVLFPYKAKVLCSFYG